MNTTEKMVKTTDNAIHWWELAPNTLILLSQEGRELFKRKRKLLGYTQAEIDKKLGKKYVIERYENDARKPRKEVLTRLLSILGISPTEFEKQICGVTSFKLREMYLTFPLEENPLHARIIANGFFDGDDTNAEIVYGSTSDDEQKMFRGCVEESFGDVCIQYTRKRTALPKCLAHALLKHYEIKTIRSLDCSFSGRLLKLLQKNKEWRIEVYLAAFTDEGCVTTKNGITALYSKNEKLINGFCSLLELDGYKYWKFETPTEVAVNIRNESVKRFYDEVLSKLPDGYYKKELVKKTLNKINITYQKRAKKKEICQKILKLAESGCSPIEMYSEFRINSAKKRKAFQDKYIRYLRQNELVFSKDGKYFLR